MPSATRRGAGEGGRLGRVPRCHSPKGGGETCQPSQHGRLNWNETGTADPSADCWADQLEQVSGLGKPLQPLQGFPHHKNIFFPTKGRTRDSPTKVALLRAAVRSPALHHQDHKGQEDTYRPLPQTQRGGKCPEMTMGWAGDASLPCQQEPLKAGEHHVGAEVAWGRCPMVHTQYWSLPRLHTGQNSGSRVQRGSARHPSDWPGFATSSRGRGRAG